jgi:energy-coupling factor transport system permease protein
LFSLTYRDTGSPIHRLGVPTKAAIFGVLFVLSLVYSDLAFLAGAIAICLTLGKIAGVGGKMRGVLSAFLLFSAVVLVINLIANQHGENVLFGSGFRFYIWRIGFQITLESISTALRMVMRLLAVVLSFLVFTLTTKPEVLLSKFSGVRGLEGFGLLLGLAYRFLPTLVSDGSEIRDSLRIRGVQFDEGGRRDRLRSYASLGIPLIANSLDRSMQLAEAMESRGYGSGQKWVSQIHEGSRFDLPLMCYYLLVGTLLLVLWYSQGVGEATLFVRTSFVYVPPIVFLLFVSPILLWRGRR